MVTNLISITLQTDSNNFLLMLLFVILAVIFIGIFFYWWRNVSDEDLEKIKELDAIQTTGPATTGQIPPEHAEDEAAAMAEEEILEAAHHHNEEADIDLPDEVEETLPEDTVEMVEAEIDDMLAESASNGETETAESDATEPDDYQKIEGVGPKIGELLHNAGLLTYAQLAEADPANLRKILDDAGPRYKLADPSSWPQQAKLAAAGHWDALDELQDNLTAGRH